MKAYCYRLALLLLLPLPLTGCKALSERAHCLGRFLDPDLQRCDPVPNCPLCGEAGPGGPGYPGSTGGCQGGCAPSAPGLSEPYPPGNGLNIEQELLSIRDQANRSEAVLGQMRTELLGRNNELIQARADYARIQNELASVRHDMTAWQNDTQQLHESLKSRDKRRLETLDEMASTLAHINAGTE